MVQIFPDSCPPPPPQISKPVHLWLCPLTGKVDRVELSKYKATVTGNYAFRAHPALVAKLNKITPKNKTCLSDLSKIYRGVMFVQPGTHPQIDG